MTTQDDFELQTPHYSINGTMRGTIGLIRLSACREGGREGETGEWGGIILPTELSQRLVFCESAYSRIGARAFHSVGRVRWWGFR